MPNEQVHLTPVKGFALLLDDGPETVEAGRIVVRRAIGCGHMDFYVVRADGTCDFGTGDRVIIAHQDLGRRILVDGVHLRLVKNEDIIAVVE